LIELAAALDEAQLAGRSPLPDPLPVGRYLSRALLRPLDDLPAPTRRALLVASAGDGSAAYLAGALLADGRSFADLEPAERAGFISIGPSRALFSHPLVRSAVYQAAPAPDRRSAHAAHAVAAERVNEAGALGRRAWHLALASAGPDEAVAAELERAARDAIGRNAHAAAMEALDAAGRLSPDDAARGGRLLAAAGSAVAAGSFSRAAVLLDEVVALAAEPSQALEAEVLRAYVEMFGGSARRAIELMVAAADRLEAVAPAAAASLLAQASMPAQIRGDARMAAALSARGAALAVDAPPEVRAVVDSATASAAAYQSRPVSLADETEECLARQAATGDPQAYFWAVAVVQFRMLEERYQDALERIGGFVGAARSRSTPSALAYPLTFRAELLLRLGRLQEALANALEATQIALETGQHAVGSYAFGTLARVEALLGRSEDCRAHAARGVADIGKSEADILIVYSGSALGLLELADGRLDEALSHLLSCEHQARGLGRPHPLMVPYVQDLIETRIRLGQTAEATEELEAFADQAEAIGAAWPRAAAERCRGLLAADDGFEEHFARALVLHGLTPTPFERGRTELCLGERRRRARRLREAREPLGDALAIFEALGAEPWAEWVRRELRAAGARPSEPRAAPIGSLTPQELRISLAVAGGATNKEAAASLFISPKTVEYHLARVYTKMGIRSRSELARRMAHEAVEGLTEDVP
jgi:DNA-binding CsgD family transcriptional regulator